MQKIIIVLLFFLSFILRQECYGQGTVKYNAGISYGTGAPTYTPTGNVSKKYINLSTLRSYTWSGSVWMLDGHGIDVISGCSAPAYSPGVGQSNFVINNCTLLQNGQGPELYVYDGSAWIFINEKSTGGGVYTGGEGIVIDSPSVRLDTLDRLSFATSPTLPGGIGTIRWNDTDGTLEFGMKGGNVIQQIGQEQLVLVKHADNAGLANGAVVYIVGSDGTNKMVRLARADEEASSANTFGIMTESATGGEKAFCTTYGLVRDINTASLTEGAMVWVSASTAGALTTTRPTAPNHAVQVGWCVRSHATQGVIFVSVQNGYELGELHDVAIKSPANGQILQYNTAGQAWVNATLSTITGSGTSGQVSFWGGASSQTGDNGLIWDNALKRLSVYGLGVQGSANTVSSFIIYNSAGEQVFKSRDNFGAEVGRSLFYTETGNTSTQGASTINSTKQIFTFGCGTTNFNMSAGSVANIVANNISVLRANPSPYNCVSIGEGATPSYTLDVRGSGGTLGVRGKALFGADGSAAATPAQLEVKSTSGGILFPRMTTTQRNAITATDGLVIYNTTVGKLQVYAAGAWVDLH